MESRPVNWRDSAVCPWWTLASWPTCGSPTFSPWPEVPDATGHPTSNLEKGWCTAVWLVSSSELQAIFCPTWSPSWQLHVFYPVPGVSCTGTLGGAVMIQLTGLGSGCCWKQVLVAYSAPACLAVDPWHFPHATSARLALECVSWGDGPAESHIKDERVFLVREDFCSLFSLKPQVFRYSSAMLWDTVKKQHIHL